MRVWILAVVWGLVQAADVCAEGSPADATSSSASVSLDSQRIDDWIADLESDQYLVRENATGKLRDTGQAAFDALLLAANGQNLEAADRSVGLLQEFARSDNRLVAKEALGRLTRLERHAAERWRAAYQLALLRERDCTEKLAALGAHIELSARTVQYEGDPQRIVALIVDFTEAWRGSEQDLIDLAQLKHCDFLHLAGSAVTDGVADELSSLPLLERMELFSTRVTPDAVARIKTARPNLAIHLRSASKLGIAGETVPGGIRITQVEPGSAAANAQLRVDDVITKFNGHPQEHFDGLTAYISQYQPGDEVYLDIVRGDQTLVKTVRLGEWSATEQR